MAPDCAWSNRPHLLWGIAHCAPVDLWIGDLFQEISVRAEPKVLRYLIGNGGIDVNGLSGLDRWRAEGFWRFSVL